MAGPGEGVSIDATQTSHKFHGKSFAATFPEAGDEEGKIVRILDARVVPTPIGLKYTRMLVVDESGAGTDESILCLPWREAGALNHVCRAGGRRPGRVPLRLGARHRPQRHASLALQPSAITTRPREMDGSVC